MTARFVAVGGSHKIATSDDGINWTQRTNSFSGTIRCVAFGESWIAVDDAENLGWSNDGITWHVQAGPAWNTVNALAWSGTEWIAVDDFGGVYRSINGVTGWTVQTTGLPGGGNAELFDVCWDPNNHQFVAVGADFSNSTGIIMVSSDGGTSWSRHTAPTGFTVIESIGTDGSGVLIIGNTGSTTTKLAKSIDGGVTWSPKTTPFTTTRHAVSIAWGSSEFVAVGTGGILAESSDAGDTWTGRTSQFGTTSILSVAFSAAIGIWVIVGLSGFASSSSNAVTWTAQDASFDTDAVTDVASGTTSSWTPAITFSANAAIRKTQSHSFAADSTVVEFGYRVHADAVLRASLTRAYVADAAIAFSIIDDQTGRNPHDRAEQHFGTMPASVVAYDRFNTVEQKLRYIWGRVALYESGGLKEGSLTAAALFHKVITVLFTANAMIGTAGMHFGSWVADSITRRTQSGSVTANADVRRTQTGSTQANAVVRRTTAGSFVADAYVLAGTSGSFTADGILLFRAISRSFTANSYVLTPSSGLFTANGTLLKTISGSFTANAVARKAISGSFTADAVVGTTGESGLLGDHTLGQHELGGE